MLTEQNEVSSTDAPRTPTRSAIGFPLPPSVVMTERATAMLRAELIRRGCGEWIIFYNRNHELFDVESHLEELGETAVWEPLAGIAAGETPDSVSFGDWGVKRWPAGLLHLDQHQVAIARWNWAQLEEDDRRPFYMIAAASAEKFQELRLKMIPFRRQLGSPVWQIIHGGYDTPQRVPRKIAGPEMTLAEPIRQRIDSEVVKFFSPEVKALYRTLGVPHRRGVMLYGPPGNGKTSLIRRIGSLIPDVPGLVLRASAGFDSDDLEAVVKRWTDLAPAMLVIEDLDWLLKAVNISTFLNTLDGISPGADGMLLIATTNHPDQLDPAINNRPGRFDVTIEIANPDRSLRESFFRERLVDMPIETASRVAERCEGLSFAHLQEVLRLSGLLAIDGDRTVRTEKDLDRAIEIVQSTNQAAQSGFPVKLEVPFGLVRRRASGRS